MSWRFRKTYRSGPFRWNVTKNGIGWSWGLFGLRYGVSPTGHRFISFSLPGTGLYWIRYFNRKPMPVMSVPSAPSPSSTLPTSPAPRTGGSASGSSSPWWKQNNPKP
ncbi:DUF4236 domain-containing protein [Candidatus Binatus sp.]|uniref:DUF4236 domain-containing protein n=1 Tax=Candidatus Binatus sp. TaxID=2811406 RepID=UPI003C79316D